MRALLVLLGLAAIVLVVLMSLGMISIGGGSLPKVSVEGGSAPKVDVGRIDVGTVNKTIEVPVVDVQKADNAAAPR
jgi:multidrug efflux pump subunit AcrA (membrane-fusion protein)